MPSKKLKAKNATIRLLEKRINQYELEKEISDMKAAEPKKTQLIKRPSGQAGCASGYNLQIAMGLAGRDQLYRVLSSLGLVEDVIELIQKHIPFFQQFANGWPIKDIIKRYLQNDQMKYKRDMAYVASCFKNSSESNWSPAIPIVAKGKGRQPETDTEDSDDSDSEFDEEDESSLSEQEDNIMDMEMKSNSTSRKYKEIVEPPKTRPGPLTRSNSKNLKKNEFTAVEPTVLSKPKSQLRGKNLKENESKVKLVTDGNAIEAKKSTLGKRKPNQDIHDYQENSDHLYAQSTSAKTRFPSPLSSKWELNKGKVAKKLMNSATHNIHCGYYGPAGESVIRTALMAFDNTKFSHSINETIPSIMLMEYPSDFKPGEYVPMKFSDFLDFILVPHVATLLIANDMDITPNAAQDERFASKGYGAAINGDTDDPEVKAAVKLAMAQFTWDAHQADGIDNSHEDAAVPSRAHKKDVYKSPVRNATPGPSSRPVMATGNTCQSIRKKTKSYKLIIPLAEPYQVQS
ncbi:hypothetical protein BDQ12DRAFT_669658 [Crucibulum laeve]|uniref:Restriction of telomere capping protein 4 C-terminal domain-containing protein n=1 Tax=Crucibulum laeve TaxID=68775 RepID=A0A5C3LQ18_9AGAR|nr:hypothetical protein BDQ12DRAFT_669658 [Crucibulum laeve]